jgi:streptogramin lyase
LCYNLALVTRRAHLRWRHGVWLASLAAILAAAANAGASARPHVRAPVVVGPRSTSLERPQYRFRAAQAVSFRCAFDSRRLHVCGARFSQRLLPGGHTLRVQALGRHGAVSRLVTVKVAVSLAYPQLAADRPIAVGAGAGVPTAGGGAVWVPLTVSGDLARVDEASGSLTGKTHVGAAAPADGGFLDSAAAANGSVWSASDEGGTIARVDAASGTETQTLGAGSRPGGLAIGGGAVWAFGFQGSTVTRVDLSTGASSTLQIDGASAAGIAYGGGALWVLSLAPAQILEADPASGAVLATFPLDAPFAPSYSVVEAWWLAYGDGAVWATLPNQGAVARLDVGARTVGYAHVPYGRPFGVAVGGGSSWVATDHGVVRFDETTARPSGAAILPPASRSGFASIAYGDGAAWFTNYDRGTLTRLPG